MAKHNNIWKPALVLKLIIIVIVIPFLPLLITGDWKWWEAWVYGGINVVGFVLSRVLAGRRHPDLIAERGRFMDHENTVAWDRMLAPLLGIGGFTVPLVAGVDALGGRTLIFSLPVKAAALIFMLAGWILGTWALMENRYFSGVVRIQSDRGQQVISTGPYRMVRHPGYSGGLLTYLAVPIFLDSLWAFVPVVLLVIILVVRTRLEDKLLQEQLEGYRDYAGRVRSRLLPGIW